MECSISSSEREISLYAIISSADAAALSSSWRGLALVTTGELAALAGKPRNRGDLARRALAHDRVVRRALVNCSSVIPFRFGATLPSCDAVTRVLEHNRGSLHAMLERFSGRLEVGLKIRLPAPSDSDSAPASLPEPLARALDGVRALLAAPQDARTRIRREAGRVTFEGAYLIERRSLAAFWAAAAEVRRREPSFPMLASGPWAPYSFCAPLRGDGIE